MFGLDDALIWGPMLGAAIGGFAKKKNPLEGALMGGALGLGGAALAPHLSGLLAAEGAAGGAVGGTGLTTGSLVGGSEAVGLNAARNGLLGVSGVPASTLSSPTLNLAANGTASQLAGPSIFKEAMGYVKPVGQAMSAANSAKSLMYPPEQPLPPMQPSPIAMAPSTGPQGLAELVSSNNMNTQFTKQKAEAEKARRMELLARMGGRYGTS